MINCLKYAKPWSLLRVIISFVCKGNFQLHIKLTVYAVKVSAYFCPVESRKKCAVD